MDAISVDENSVYMEDLYKNFYSERFMKLLIPHYYILFFNEIPVNPRLRGCY